MQSLKSATINSLYVIYDVCPFTDLSVFLFTIDPIKAGMSLFFLFLFACRSTETMRVRLYYSGLTF